MYKNIQGNLEITRRINFTIYLSLHNLPVKGIGWVSANNSKQRNSVVKLNLPVTKMKIIQPYYPLADTK